MGNVARFGSVEWAAAKAAAACRHGLSEVRRDCHARAGDWIRRNPGRASDPGCRLVLFALPSGTVAHSAVSFGGELYHDPSDIAGRPIGEYRVAARIPASTILDAATARAAPAPVA